MKSDDGATAKADSTTPGPWPSRVALLFVLLTLGALVVVPWLVQREVNALRREIVASEPARTLVMRWQLDLVRELAALGDSRLAGDAVDAARYQRVLREEEALQLELTRLVEKLGPQVAEPLVEARILAARWHERVGDALERGTTTDGPLELPLFAQVLVKVAAVDSAIIRSTARTRERIAAAESAGLVTTFVLGALALIAAVAVVALSSHMRRFAKAAERGRHEAAAALEERARADEARVRLLRGITHDVKNPLGAARGYAELLAMGVKAPLHREQEPLVEGVQRSIDSALAIIADLLDLARADSGDVVVRQAEVDLNEVARGLLRDYETLADTAGHEIEGELATEPLAVRTDPVRVRQVLDNLLSNAIKYTPAPGRIVVSSGRIGEEQGAPEGEWAIVKVSDTGPGVPAEFREVVFDEFSRVDDASPTKGHGLGLAIARSLARRLGGDLTLADEGPGATFVLRLPLNGHGREPQPSDRA